MSSNYNFWMCALQKHPEKRPHYVGDRTFLLFSVDSCRVPLPPTEAAPVAGPPTFLCLPSRRSSSKLVYGVSSEKEQSQGGQTTEAVPSAALSCPSCLLSSCQQLSLEKGRIQAAVEAASPPGCFSPLGCHWPPCPLPPCCHTALRQPARGGRRTAVQQAEPASHLGRACQGTKNLCEKRKKNSTENDAFCKS